MPVGTGVRLPSKRTRTGCLTCRKSKVKCDEKQPNCSRCRRLELQCLWQNKVPQLLSKRNADWPLTQRGSNDFIPLTSTKLNALRSIGPTVGQVTSLTTFATEEIFYVHHFITFCTRFLAYSNDSEGNPFQQVLVPLAFQSPALHHSMVALAAGHLARRQPMHALVAMKYYIKALGSLNETLSGTHAIDNNAVLGTSLLLCVYEIARSKEGSWSQHLQGARDLILQRGALKAQDFLVRFFSLLDISASLLTSQDPLIRGHYWLDVAPDDAASCDISRWPYYDGGIMVDNFHALMVYMAQLSSLSNWATTAVGRQHPTSVQLKAQKLRTRLLEWWDSRPFVLRHQPNDWRTRYRDRGLSAKEILEQESFSSTRSVVYGCLIYLHHILDPLGKLAQPLEVVNAVKQVFEIARQTPEGSGLEMGLFFGLFMAGVALRDDIDGEQFIQRKMSNPSNIALYHADNALLLLEALWAKQRHNKRIYDWREVQKGLDIHVFILV